MKAVLSSETSVNAYRRHIAKDSYAYRLKDFKSNVKTAQQTQLFAGFIIIKTVVRYLVTKCSLVGFEGTL
jgi:hypothetical protein